MTDRQRLAYERMTPDQRASVDRIRASFKTPEFREEADRIRKEVTNEFPPRAPDPETAEAMARLRLERERKGLSLADLSERTKIDPTALSRLERGLGNPTLGTLNRVAAALGMRLEWSLIEAAGE